MNKKEYVSVAEFSRKIGKTPQAVYKHVDKKLKPYVKRTSGKIFIDITAVSLFGVSANSTKINNQFNNQVESELIAELRREIDELRADKERLMDMLEHEQTLRLNEQRLQLPEINQDIQDAEKPVGFWSKLFKKG